MAWNNKKTIETKNDKNQIHGYYEYYYNNNESLYRTIVKNNRPIGYTENHAAYGTNTTRFHIR